MTVKRIDLELFPASLETMHVYTAVSSTVGAKMTRDPDDSNLKRFFFLNIVFIQPKKSS